MKKWYLICMLAFLSIITIASAKKIDSIHYSINSSKENILEMEDDDPAISTDAEVSLYLDDLYMNSGDEAYVSWAAFEDLALSKLGESGVTQKYFREHYDLHVVGDNASYAVRYSEARDGAIAGGESITSGDAMPRLDQYTNSSNWFGRVWYSADSQEKVLTWNISTDASSSNMTRPAFIKMMSSLEAAYATRGTNRRILSTIVRFINKDNGSSIWVKLMVPEGKVHFAYADFTARNLDQWYDLKEGYRQNTPDTMEVYVNIPTPEETGNMPLNTSSFSKDLNDYWRDGRVRLNLYDNTHFSQFANGSNVSFSFCTPRSGVNSPDQSADRNGKWTVTGASGTRYTLYVNNDKNRILAQRAGSMASDEVVCTLSSDGIIQYSSGNAACDILNAIGLYSANGDRQKTVYLTGHKDRAFTAYVQLNVTSNADYDPLVGQDYFNVRFLRPVNAWPVATSASLETGKAMVYEIWKLINIRDWRTYAIVPEGQTQMFTDDGKTYEGNYSGSSVPYGFYGISNLYVRRGDIQCSDAGIEVMLLSKSDASAADVIMTGKEATTRSDDVLVIRANQEVTGTVNVPIEVVYAYGTENYTQRVTVPITVNAENTSVTIEADNLTMIYGDDVPALTYKVIDGIPDGAPILSCEATSSSPVGIYPIIINKGSLKNSESNLKAGTLTITRAPLTIRAKNYTINQGDVLPEFEAEFVGFKNDETEDVLSMKPILVTTAENSEIPGTYDIIISGAEAKNYDISYESGILTIIPMAIKPIETVISIDTENLDGQDLTNNVLANVYYNVGADGYDATDHSIVISKTTNMRNIIDVKPGSTDIKDYFTGLILMIGKGKGIITVNVKTTGNAQLVVQLDDGTPMIASKAEQGNVIIGYDVNEDTYVYIYAIIGSSRVPAHRSAPENAVKIYNIEISPETTGIGDIKQDALLQNDHYFTLDGRKMEGQPTTKGLYIMNGKKIIIK